EQDVCEETREQPAKLVSRADDVEIPAVPVLLNELSEQQLDAPALPLGLEGAMGVGCEGNEEPRSVSGDGEEEVPRRHLLREFEHLDVAVGRWRAEVCPTAIDRLSEVLDSPAQSNSSSSASASSVSR